jgi:heptosyltransferase-2
VSTASPALLVRLHNWIGDVIVGLPALALLAEHGVRVELVGKPWAASLLAGHGWPVHVQPQGLRARAAQWKALNASLLGERLRVGGKPIDALLLATSFSSALECRLGGVRAYGYDTDSRRWLLARARPRPQPQGLHMVEEQWRLACALLGIERPVPREIGLVVTPAASAAADALLASHGVDGPYAVLCPFATGTLHGRSKVWPGFQQLARTLRERGVPVLLCPGPGEEDAAEAGYPGTTILPRVPLADYAALLQRATVVVANDTGPGHMAAAVGAPLVSVLGPTDSMRWGPWGSRVRVVQRPDGWPPFDAVLAQVLQRLGG